jgi:methylmalonyl-CoA mutase
VTVPPEELRLAADFPAATAERWRELALGVLRKSGAAGDETTPGEVPGLLATGTYDGVRVEALYDAGPPARNYTRAAAGSWDVRQRYAGGEPGAVREALLADLENGATSVWLVLGPGGLPVDALPGLLDGVHLGLAGVALDAGPGYADAAGRYLDLVSGSGAGGQATGTLGADPLGWQARTGEALGSTGLAGLAARAAAVAPNVRAVTVDATPYHEAGGSDAEELGCALAAGVAYLRALTDGGLDTAHALGQLEFRYAATADQFATISKLRAARRLWARVADACGAAAAGGQRQHAVTSAAMMTARDPWVNLLRTTLACFAAGVGGADAVTVLPFDHRLGLPDGLARRLARNTQTLLVEEASLARVADPAAGSWYVERRTDDLSRAAWAWFQQIERAGGLAAALASGLVADRLAATWQRRADDIAHRRQPLTGTSEFPNPTETLPARAPAPAEPVGGLPRHHYGEAYERLRDRADAAPERPRVFLATLGSAAANGPRVTFAANLFAAAGIATSQGEPADFAASGAAVACVCGPDKAYAEGAAPAAAQLLAAGARRVWLAGRGEYDGIGGNLFTGCDALAVLTTTLDDLEVA